MKRVIVIGSGGAGKSTFSRELGEITRLPVVHLDKLHWHPNWVGTPTEEWEQVVRREIEKPEWIIDGISAARVRCECGRPIRSSC